MAKKQNNSKVRVVCDQFGTPTNASNLANVICTIINKSELEKDNVIIDKFDNYVTEFFTDYLEGNENIYILVENKNSGDFKTTKKLKGVVPYGTTPYVLFLFYFDAVVDFIVEVYF